MRVELSGRTQNTNNCVRGRPDRIKIKIIIKQDQGSKAPSRDYPNSSFMIRLDYIRVED